VAINTMICSILYKMDCRRSDVLIIDQIEKCSNFQS